MIFSTSLACCRARERRGRMAMRVLLWKVERNLMVESLHCLPRHTLHPHKMPLPLVRSLRTPLPPRMIPWLRPLLRRRNDPRKRGERRGRRKRHPLPLLPRPPPSVPWGSPVTPLMIWSTTTHSQSCQVGWYRWYSITRTTLAARVARCHWYSISGIMG